MQILESHIDKNGSTFKANRDRMLQLTAELRSRIATARQGGGPKYVERHRKQGKLPVRERLERLVDPEFPFLELSPLAGLGVYADDTPAAGIISGAGRGAGHEVVIVAHHRTVEGGTYYPLTAEKH